jgi:hypothetical protein
MPKSSQGAFAILSIVLFAFWLFVALPLLYAPRHGDAPNEILGVKYGEWLMFAATIALWVATMGLWLATSQLVKGADKTAERQLRAYVMLDRASIKSTATGQHYIDLAFKNWGKTPAHNGVVKFESDVCALKEKDLIIPLTDKAETMSNLVFAPGHQQTIHINKNEISWTNWQNGGWGMAVYVWGRLNYTDAFDEPRFTTFQLVHTFTEVEEFAVCANGNEAQ